MTRLAKLFVALAAAVVLTGCGDSKPDPVPTDPESIEKLKEEQMKESRGER